MPDARSQGRESVSAEVSLLMTDSSPPTIHRIRLQGPWEWSVPTAVLTHAWTWNRIRLPDEWDRLPVTSSAVWFRRRFNTPTGITPTDRIRVAITTAHRPSAVLLNGQALSALPLAGIDETSIIHYEITSTLAERNLLEIVFAQGILPPALDGGMGRPVVLEIESIPS
jgi:hypothetical protein